MKEALREFDLIPLKRDGRCWVFRFRGDKELKVALSDKKKAYRDKRNPDYEGLGVNQSLLDEKPDVVFIRVDGRAMYFAYTADLLSLKHKQGLGKSGIPVTLFPLSSFITDKLMIYKLLLRGTPRQERMI